MPQSTNAKRHADQMKLLVLIPCPECRGSFPVELREFSRRRQFHCSLCRRPVSPDSEQLWQMLRQMREEIRRITSGGGLSGL